MRARGFRLALGLGLAGAAACGGDPQIVLELAGDVPGARSVDVVLLEPRVLAREQRHNNLPKNDGGTLETVFYMEERSRTAIDLQGKSTDKFQLEIQGAGGPYVPLIAVQRDTGAQPQLDPLLALGVYNPPSIFAAPLDREHAPDAVSPVSDVTIFRIDLEPVDRVFALAPGALAPPLVKSREVMRVPCAATGATSGVVWRRADGIELRVLLPEVRPPGAEAGADRLEPPDLDCDQHSPGRNKVLRGESGDRRDCDDTAFAVHGGVRERCSALDDDCNTDTTLSPTPCSLQCPSVLQICACDDAAQPESCTAPIATEPCKLMATSSGGPGRQPCESAGPIKLPPLCANGCEVLLAWAPDGLEVALSDDPGQARHELGEWAPSTDGAVYLSVRAGRPLATTPLVILGRARTGTAAVTFSIPLQLVDVAACEAPPSPLECSIL